MTIRVLVCKTCRLSKLEHPDDFPYQSDRKYLRSYCKKCWYQHQKKRRTNNPHRNRVKRLRRYELTIEKYDNLVKEQQGRCLICNREAKLVVDHSHKTLQRRGLLCSPCNTLLGLAQESTEVLESAIKYLKSYP